MSGAGELVHVLKNKTSSELKKVWGMSEPLFVKLF